MSATNRGAVRADKDFYPTNSWIVHRFLEAWQPRDLARPWLEPCAGEGSIIGAVNEIWKGVSWHAVELNGDGAVVEKLSAAGARTIWPGWDFLKWEPQGMMHAVTRPYAVAFTNPPYSIAWDVIKHAMQFAEQVVMLLRVNFLGSEGRAAWLKEHTPNMYILPNRPSYGVNEHGRKGTDATEYAWYVWDATRRRGQPGTVQILNLTPDNVRAEQWNQAFGHLVRECACPKCEQKRTGWPELEERMGR
jgi:hypothetical protein